MATCRTIFNRSNLKVKNDLFQREGLEMDTKKRIMIGLLAFLLLVPTFFISSWGWDYMRANQAVNNFAKIVEQGDLSNLSLTIYYASPSLFVNPRWSIDFFRMSAGEKIAISGSELEEHIDLFKQISSDDLVPILPFDRIPLYIDEFKCVSGDHGLLAAVHAMWDLSSIHVRMYYVFECKESGKLFDVIMWGYGGIIVNGFVVENRRIFYEIIMPFLPEDAAEEWERWIDRWEW